MAELTGTHFEHFDCRICLQAQIFKHMLDSDCIQIGKETFYIWIELEYVWNLKYVWKFSHADLVKTQNIPSWFSHWTLVFFRFNEDCKFDTGMLSCLWSVWLREGKLSIWNGPQFWIVTKIMDLTKLSIQLPSSIATLKLLLRISASSEVGGRGGWKRWRGGVGHGIGMEGRGVGRDGDGGQRVRLCVGSWGAGGGTET